MNRSSLPLGLNRLKKWWDDPARILRCDLPYQRLSGAWNSITKSNLVWSLLADSYIPAIVLLKDKVGKDDKNKDVHVYNIEDGQQRLTNLFSYMNDEWACHSATPPVIVDGFTYDLAGLKFSELPEELQNMISQYRFSVQCLENYTMEEAETLFYNINSGVALSAIQKSKSKMGTELIKFFAGLLDGNFFTQAINITEAQARREDDLLILLQAALLLDNRHENVEYKSISAANCLAYASSIRDKYNSDKQQMIADVIHYLDRAFTTKNKFLRKNNAPIVIVMAKIALEQEIEEKTFCGFINLFANSIYPAYEEASGSGNVKGKLVQMRLRVMFLAFCEHFDLDPTKVQKPFSDSIPLMTSVVEQEEDTVSEPSEDMDMTQDEEPGVDPEEVPETESEEFSADENDELDADAESSDAEYDVMDEISEEEIESVEQEAGADGEG